MKPGVNDEPREQDGTAQPAASRRGQFMLPSTSGLDVATPRLRQRGMIWLVVGITFVNGLFNIALVLALRVSAAQNFLDTVLPFSVHQWSRTLTLVFGFLLVYLSLQLLQRRRIASTVAAVLALLSVIAHLAREEAWYAALIPALTLIILLITRSQFTVRSEPRSVRRGVGLLVASVVIAVLYGAAGFWLLERAILD